MVVNHSTLEPSHKDLELVEELRQSSLSWIRLSKAAAKQIFIPGLVQVLRLLRRELSIKMGRSATGSMSRASSLEKEGSLSATNSFNVTTKPLPQPRSSKNRPCRGVEPNKSGWVRSKSTDVWNIKMWLNSRISLKRVKMFTSCWSFVTTKVWTSYSKGGRGYMS